MKYSKEVFLEDVKLMEYVKRPPSVKEIQQWAVQYDLYALGYRGQDLRSTTTTLCSDAQLETPSESLVEIFSRDRSLR